VQGTAADPRLPVDRLEAVLVIDTYHHFTNCEAMLRQIRRSLKPGGRLIIADYSFADHRSEPRPEQVKLHEISPELVRAELASAGFQVQECQDPFVKWRRGVGNTRASATDLWLMTAIRTK
jgi:predicted methyltransferase